MSSNHSHQQTNGQTNCPEAKDDLIHCLSKTVIPKTMTRERLAEANNEYRKGNLRKAIEIYQEVATSNDLPTALMQSVIHNINLAKSQADSKSVHTVDAAPNRITKIQERDHRIISDSGLFDYDFYKKNFAAKDSLESEDEDALISHFLDQPADGDRRPNPAFSNKQYLDLNPDVKRASINAFVHFITRGAFEERKWLAKDPEQKHFWGFRFQCIQSQIIKWNDLRVKHRDPKLTSIVIPVYGQPELLSQCIRSITSAYTKESYEVILVDNRRDEKTSMAIDTLMQNHQFIKVQRNKFNYNFALGCNTGFMISSGKYVVFLNSDTEVTDNWLDELIAPLKNRKDIVATQPKLVYPDKTVQTIGTVVSPWANMPFELYKGHSNDSPHINYSRKFNIVCGACMAVSADEFVQKEGFSPEFVNGCEDIDLCLRLIEDYTKSCLYCHKAEVVHHESKSPGRGNFNEVNRMHFKNKWSTRLRDDSLDIISADGFCVTSWNIDSSSRINRGINSTNPAGYTKSNQPAPTHIYGENNPFEKVEDICEIALDQAPGFIIKNPTLEYNKQYSTLVLVGHDCSSQMYGSERSFIDICRALSGLSLNVVITLPKPPSKDYFEILIGYCHSIVVFDYPWWSSRYKGSRIVTNKFRSVIELFKADFVYINTIMPVDAPLAARICKVSVITHVRELITDDSHLQAKIGESPASIIEAVHSRSDVLIANSSATAAMLGNGKQVVVAKNIVDIDAFKSTNVINPSRIFFGLISSNIPKKGIRDFISLAKQCSNDVTNAVFALIGPLNDHIKQIVDDLKPGDLKNILVAGYYDQSFNAVNSVNVVLSLSHFSESFGRTIAEGFAASRPAIAYDRGALGELVINHYSGLLVEPGSAESLKEAILYFCANPSKINEYGANAEKYVTENCSPKQLQLNIARALIISMLRSLVSQPIDFSRLLANIECHNEGSEQRNRLYDYVHFIKEIQTNITIVIPVYNALVELRKCVDSVLEFTNIPCWKLVIVDDCSTDPHVKPYLKSIEQIDRIEVRYNQSNIGYTKTINSVVRSESSSHIVLLNSDTVVTPNWILSLAISAYSSQSVGTVTPMSNNAGAFSFPSAHVENPIPDGLAHDEYARLICIATQNVKCIEVPTGNGFCMFIKRQLLDTVGVFDEINFPKGYGEENEFCMRGLKHGFINLLTPTSYIYHVKTASFKGERTKLMDSGQAAMKRLFPSYFSKVKRAFNSKEVSDLRTIVDEATKDLSQAN